MTATRRQFGFTLAAAAALAVMSDVADATTPEQKVAAIAAQRGADARALLAKAGVSYPPKQLLLRVFKGDGELELWARGAGEFRLVKTYAICARSGILGPKRREGDGQVPEGVYRIVHFNPMSNFHLSMGIDYPNASDRVFADPKYPGGNIYIHGGCATIGCIPIGNPGIEEVYLIGLGTRAAGGRVDVHIFPCRLNSAAGRADMATMVSAQPGLKDFWQDLDAIQAAFDHTHQLPAVTINTHGRYGLSQ